MKKTILLLFYVLFLQTPSSAKAELRHVCSNQPHGLRVCVPVDYIRQTLSTVYIPDNISQWGMLESVDISLKKTPPNDPFFLAWENFKRSSIPTLLSLCRDSINLSNQHIAQYQNNTSPNINLSFKVFSDSPAPRLVALDEDLIKMAKRAAQSAVPVEEIKNINIAGVTIPQSQIDSVFNEYFKTNLQTFREKNNKGLMFSDFDIQAFDDCDVAEALLSISNDMFWRKTLTESANIGLRADGAIVVESSYWPINIPHSAWNGIFAHEISHIFDHVEEYSTELMRQRLSLKIKTDAQNGELVFGSNENAIAFLEGMSRIDNRNYEQRDIKIDHAGVAYRIPYIQAESYSNFTEALTDMKAIYLLSALNLPTVSYINFLANKFGFRSIRHTTAEKSQECAALYGLQKLTEISINVGRIFMDQYGKGVLSLDFDLQCEKYLTYLQVNHMIDKSHDAMQRLMVE